MEKLIVKSFGPIKEAEIDLAKYVVFIGDTSTGKSVLAKLISIFRDSNLRIDSNETFKELLSNYNIEFSNDDTSIIYTNNELNITILNGEVKVYVNGKASTIEYKSAINNLNEADDYTLLNLFRKNVKTLNFTAKEKEEFKEILKHFKKFEINEPIYIPAERILNSLIGNSISGLWANNVALPICFKDFAARYEVARKNTKKASYETFGFSYSFDNGNEMVTFEETSLLLSKTSSGIQSLLPLLLVLDYEIKSVENGELDRTILIEEPELNLYPIKQKYLIEYIVSKINKTDNKVIFTTHSPYILSSLDSLIFAKNTFNERPEYKEKIDSIISEDKWIDFKDISVYEVRNDGKVYSIKNEEFKSIDANTIDIVSDIISEEFDKLTSLRYAH